MIRRFLIIFLAGLMWWAMNCGGTTAGGGVSAPPIELDAPITGRITIGAPDATGKVIITGSPGAAEPGSIMMAVNEAQTSASISKLAKVTVEEIEEICAEPGSYFTVVRSDGSFEIILFDTETGDFIFLVLINELCEELTERAFFSIPDMTTELELGLCAGEDVDRSVADLLNLDGEYILLQKGDENNSNLLTVDVYPIPIPGCHARQLGVIPDVNSGKVVAISDKDKWVFSATYSGRLISNVDTYQLEHEPLAMAYIGDPDIAAMALRTPTGLAVAHVDLNDGSIPLQVSIPEPTSPEHALSDVVTMKSTGPFENGEFLIVLIMKGGSTDERLSYLAFFNGTTLKNMTMGAETLPMDQQLLIGSPPGPATDDITDAVITDFDYKTFMIVANHGMQLLHIRGISGEFNGQVQVLDLHNALVDYSELILDRASFFNRDVAPLDSPPRKLALGHNDVGEKILYFIADEPGLFMATKLFSTSVDPNVTSTRIEGLVDPVAIATFENLAVQSILIADEEPTFDLDVIEGAEIFDVSDSWIYDPLP
jgi:hypothetical protein